MTCQGCAARRAILGPSIKQDGVVKGTIKAIPEMVKTVPFLARHVKKRVKQ